MPSEKTMPVCPSLFPIKIEADDDTGGEDPAHKKKKGKGKGGNTKAVCSVCGEEGKKTMQSYLACCRKDVEAAENDAKASSAEALEHFKNQAKDPDQLKEIIMRYRLQCPSRGQGRPRDAFDWLQEIQTHSKESLTGEGFEGEMMDFLEFAAWYKARRGASHEQCLAHWLEIEAKTPVEKRDNEGFGANREPGKQRLPVVTKAAGFFGTTQNRLSNSVTLSTRAAKSSAKKADKTIVDLGEAGVTDAMASQMEGMGVSPETLKIPKGSSGWKPDKRKSDKDKKDGDPGDLPTPEKRPKIFDLETAKADHKKEAKGYVQAIKTANDKLLKTTEDLLECLQEF
jgi:hypothetical protein